MTVVFAHSITSLDHLSSTRVDEQIPQNGQKSSLRERVGLGLLLSLRHDLNCASAGLSVGGPEHRGGSSKMSSVDRNVMV